MTSCHGRKEPAKSQGENRFDPAPGENNYFLGRDALTASVRRIRGLASINVTLPGVVSSADVGGSSVKNNSSVSPGESQSGSVIDWRPNPDVNANQECERSDANMGLATARPLRRILLSLRCPLRLCAPRRSICTAETTPARKENPPASLV